ncbi:MAG: succinylglutamate desuccinylase/aspartoacylase family protein [Microgenomates group bacterium]
MAKKFKYSFSPILTGSDLSRRRLALMEAKSENPGPVIWFTAAVHGDEVGGIVIIQEIFKKLKKGPLLKGLLYAFPLMNPIGFESATRNIPVSEEDLNRAFPGNPSGSLAERIADTIFKKIIETKPKLVLDLHNDWMDSIPYTLVDPNPGVKYEKEYEATVRFAQKTGFLVVNEEEEDSGSRENLRKTLTGSLINIGIPAITLELGEAYIVNEKNVEIGTMAIWNILEDLGMVNKNNLTPLYELPSEFKNKILKYSHQPVSSTSGIIRFLVKPGEKVHKGQKMAKIYNVLGKLRETIVAQNDAIVLGTTDSAVSLPGVPVVALGIL